MTATLLSIVMIQIAPMTPIAKGVHPPVILLILSPVMVIAFLRMESAVTVGTAVTAHRESIVVLESQDAARQAMNAAVPNAVVQIRNVWGANA